MKSRYLGSLIIGRDIEGRAQWKQVDFYNYKGISYMKVFSYNTQLTFDLTEEDKEIAKKAELYFNHLLRLLDKAVRQLNVLYDPMKESPEVSQEQTVKNRSSLREYRDQICKNFNEVKRM